MKTVEELLEERIKECTNHLAMFDVNLQRYLRDSDKERLIWENTKAQYERALKILKENP